jgi:putative FmdB family regulatory protein
VENMPIYEYQASGQDHCDHCKNTFDVMQKVAEEPLKLCPQCYQPVSRKVSRPNLARAAPSLSEENIEKHGLTQFKKVEKGVYEKTAGKGPDYIMDDKTS